EPYNADANTSLINLYIELDKKDVAIKEMEELVKAEPDNKIYWEQYGSLLMNFGDYDSAIEKYKKSLSIDPNYDFALRNIASAYKNKAYKIQVEEQDKLDKDPKYKINVEAFLPYLRSSAEFFERSLNTEQFRDDMDVLAELANIYLVTNEKNKLDAVVSKLEAIEDKIDDSKKSNYYLKMIKIYSDMKNEKKLKEVQSKFENIK
ncbi:MAG TPA: tetratricopeptide repeat protein, partial [Candidatus Kapabacteria bacterium]|nr:tetratricopeptide repeat protein [Candidatus Kapabacteria bacterium]